MADRRAKLNRLVDNRRNATGTGDSVTGAGAPGTPAKAPRAARDLGDPDTQKEILFPVKRPIVLSLPDGDVAASLRTQFTYADIMDRRILEDIEAFSRLFLGTAKAMGFDGDIRKSGYVLDAAAMKSSVREAARDILVKLITFDEPQERVVNGKVFEATSPTLEELEQGISGYVMAALAVWLFEIFTREADKRKNSPATAPKSA